MDFEVLEVDEDIFNLVDQIERKYAHKAPPAAPKPASSVVATPSIPQVPIVAPNSLLQAPSGRFKPSAPPPSIPAAPLASPPLQHTNAPQKQLPLTRESINGATSISIELSYGGKSRIRVSVVGHAPTVIFAQKAVFSRPSPVKKPLINSDNLPRFAKEAFERVQSNQNTSAWDLPSTNGDGPWPLYEECQIDLRLRTGEVLAHWLFPTRVLSYLDLHLRKAVEAENSLQLAVTYSSRVSIRYVPLTDYVRKLIIECNAVAREAERIANLAPPPNAPPSALEISTIIPHHLLETELFRSLKDYQVQGVEFALCRNGRLLLADAPGLGKTIQSIAIATCYPENWPVLVICPSSVRTMWAGEFERWVPGLDLNDISTNFSGKKTSLKAKVNVISYELLKSPKIMESVWSVDPRTGARTHPFGVVICDECHLLKTFKSARTQAILPLVQKAKRAILLSGTPATARPKELHTQLSGVLPSVFQYFPNFGDRYCDPHPVQFGGGVDYSGASNLHELHLLLTEALMIRRQKAEVLGDMPSKRRHQLLLDIPKEQQKMLVNMSKEMSKVAQSMSSAKTSRYGAKKSANAKKTAGGARIDDDEATEVGGAEAMDIHALRGRQHHLVLEMFQNAGRAKLPSAIAHLKNCLSTSSEDTKFLVFAHHLDVLDGFSHALRQMGVEYIRIDGKTANTMRQSLVDHFQNTPSCRVAVLSLLAAGVGITLTRASKVFFAELYWDPAALLQAEDRAHRIGQEKEVDVFYMIAKGSYDEKLWEAIDSKLSVLSAVLDAKKGRLSLDSVSRSGANDGNSKIMDSFIGYLIQKIDGFGGRSEGSKERAELRRRARNGTLLLDEEDISDDDSSIQTTSLHQKTSPSSKPTAGQAPPAALNASSSSSAAADATDTSNTRNRATSSINLSLDDESDDDSFEALFKESPAKKFSPLPSSSSSEVHMIASNPVLPLTAHSPTSPTVITTAPRAIPQAVEQKRMDKLSRFALPE